jgi:hypothetical protein
VLERFLSDALPVSVQPPASPPFNVTLCLAVKFGTGASGRKVPIGDLALSTPPHGTAARKPEDTLTAPMLFAARFMPLPEELGQCAPCSAGSLTPTCV